MNVLSLKWINDHDNGDVERFSIIRYKPDSRIPSVFLESTSSFTSITRTSEELSIVCPTSMIKDLNNEEFSNCIESDYICFKVLGPLDFSLVGIINAISSRYVHCGISIFVISTYDTDYVLTKVNSYSNFSIGKLIEIIFEDYNHHDKYTFKFKELLFSSGYQSKIKTLVDFIDRTSINIIKPRVTTIHFVGADEEELPTLNEKILSIMYERIIAKCNNVFEIDRLNLVFIGPNMNKEFDKKSVDFKVKISNIEIDVNISAYSTFYHDHFDHVSNELIIAKPEIIVLYNAGIWGYDSWLLTLNVFRYLKGTAVLLTSYTIEEGEDDEDTIEKFYNDIGVDPKIYRWEWSAVENPNKSSQKLDRKTMKEREYYENFSWSGLLFI